MKAQGMWENIVRHSVLVERVACCLAERLVEEGAALDLAEITAAALLHDITKTSSIQTRENHAATGRTLLERMGYHRIGEIVGCHILMPAEIFSQEGVSAEEVVYYADKRVLHDLIVSLGQRFEDLVVRYGSTPEARSRLRILEEQSYRIEEKIFSHIAIAPEDIPAIVSE